MTRVSRVKAHERKPPRSVVLLVDDDQRTLKQLGRRLRRTGYKVLPTSSCNEALKKFKPGQIDGVIADWNLGPKQDNKGDALFQEIRKQDWEVPLVLVSGKLSEDSERAKTFDHLIKSGAAQFVERGEGYEKILAGLQGLLARRDVVLTELIHKLRATHGTIPTSSGRMDSARVLKGVLRDYRWKGGTLSGLAKEFAEWEIEKLKTKQHS